MLFVDEAYTLCENHSFGGEAIDAIMHYTLEYPGQLVVVVAGYEEDMNKFLRYNPGLPSRFSNTITLPGYTNDELLEITKRMAAKQDFGIEQAAFPIITLHMDAFRKVRREANVPFGNAREAENLLQAARVEGASRLAKMVGGRSKIKRLTALTKDDFSLASNRMIQEANSNSAGL